MAKFLRVKLIESRNDKKVKAKGFSHTGVSIIPKRRKDTPIRALVGKTDNKGT